MSLVPINAKKNGALMQIGVNQHTNYKIVCKTHIVYFLIRIVFWNIYLHIRSGIMSVTLMMSRRILELGKTYLEYISQQNEWTHIRILNSHTPSYPPWLVISSHVFTRSITYTPSHWTIISPHCVIWTIIPLHILND